jgi:CDGSH-type Zn-finger protein
MSSPVQITLVKNGPIKITGAVEVTDADGNRVELPVDKPAIFLCRCGESARKPFCDGKHKTNGFCG